MSATSVIYLLGTDHKYQCGGRDCSLQQADIFAEQVRAICRKYDIRRIAEEMSAEGRRNYEVEETVAMTVARELAIHHHEVDLSACERQALSTSDSAVLNARTAFRCRDGGVSLRRRFVVLTDQVRERVWAARIMDNNPWPVLFIFGSDHVSTFGRILRRLGGAFEVVHNDYVP